MRSRDGSLVFFTVLSQWSIGIIACLTGLMYFSNNPVVYVEPGLNLANPVFLSLLLILAATTMSFLHLGNPANAPGALRNLATSWLSREILAIGIFSFSLVVMLGVSWTMGDSRIPANLLVPATLTGVFLLWTMIRVYLIPTIPAWNSAYTPLSFVSTTLCLGLVSCLVFMLEKQASVFCIGLLVAVLILEMISALLHQHQLVNMDTGIDGPTFDSGALYKLFLARMAVLLVACLWLIFLALLPGDEHLPWLYPVLVLVILQEFAGRLLFYASYFRTGL